MTYIEFFDKTSIENICACLIRLPERVILLGDKMRVLKKYAEIYSDIFSKRGCNIEFVCRTVNKNNIKSIIEVLEGIVCEYEDCVFDLTGGEDLYLTAIGIVSERYKEKNIQMHRINVRNATISDCDQDGYVIASDKPLLLSVDENIRIYGGDIVYERDRRPATRVWDMNDAFKSDIKYMWNICKQDVRLWNTQIGIFETVAKAFESDGLTLSASMGHLGNVLRSSGAKFVWIRSIIDRLYSARLITAYECNESSMTVTFKNEQVKACLTKAGQILEIYVYMISSETLDNDGIKVYNDVKTGTSIEWGVDTESGDESARTQNEIDVLMMHGLIPVFVSCKNGFVEMEELYKLKVVSEQFGGEYAKKVIIANALPENSGFADHFRQRADDMNIRIVEGFQDMSVEEQRRTVKSFWCN